MRPSFKVGGLGDVLQLHSSPGPPARKTKESCLPPPPRGPSRQGASRLAPLTRGCLRAPSASLGNRLTPKKPGAVVGTSRAPGSLRGSYGYARTVTPGKWPGAGPYDYYFRVGNETTVSPGRRRAYWVTSPFPHPRRVVASVAPLTDRQQSQSGQGNPEPCASRTNGTRRGGAVAVVERREEPPCREGAREGVGGTKWRRRPGPGLKG